MKKALCDEHAGGAGTCRNEGARNTQRNAATRLTEAAFTFPFASSTFACCMAATTVAAVVVALVVVALTVCCAAQQPGLCPEMETDGDTWSCLECGGAGEYACSDNMLPEYFCIVEGDNLPGCTLSPGAGMWFCCRYCAITGKTCQYQANGGDRCTECSEHGDCYQSCVFECGGSVANVDKWSCRETDGELDIVCQCVKSKHGGDDTSAPSLTWLNILLIVLAGVLALLCLAACVGFVVTLVAYFRRPAGYQAVQ